VLLFLGRNLPKSPPAPLYYNHAQRLLFWTPDPPCFSRILKPQLPTRTDESPARTRTWPRSKAQEIGLDESDEDEEKAAGDASRYIEGARVMSAEEDVSRGGYPTFAPGSGIGQPWRHVPSGTLEQDRFGETVRFAREADDPVSTRSGGRRVRQESHDSAFESIQADLIDGPRPAHTLPRPQRNPKSKAGRTENASTVTEDLAYSGTSRLRASRESPDRGTKDYGPQFPLPPSRGRARHKQEMSRIGLRPRSLPAGVHSALTIPGHTIPGASAASERTHIPPARIDTLDPRLEIIISPTPSMQARPVSTVTAVSTPSPISAHIAQAQYGQVAAGRVLDRQLSASPELLIEEDPAADPAAKAGVAKGSARSMSVGYNTPMQSSIKRAASDSPYPTSHPRNQYPPFAPGYSLPVT
jgi:hypothetical protein